MQNYASHRHYIPLFHFFAAPVLAINILVWLYQAIGHPSLFVFWNVIVAGALFAFSWEARKMATHAQDRIIRLEETLRLERLLPPDLQSRIAEIRPGQLIGLRFASDEELPELVRAILSGEVHGREEIKKRIRNWRPDNLRV